MSNPSPAAALAEVAAAYWQFQCREFPLAALLAGESLPDAILFREAVDDYDRRDALARSLLEDLARVPADSLADQDRVTHRLLCEELEDLRRLHAVDAHLRPPLLPLGPDYGTVHFANTAAITDAASAERYVERLATLPGFIRDIEARLRTGLERGYRYPRVVLEAAARGVRGSFGASVEDSPWLGPFKRSPAAGRESVVRLAGQAQSLVREQLLPALADYAALLEGPLLRDARDSIACTDAPAGREFYAAQVRHYTTTALGPEEIHALGQSELSRLCAAIEAVAAEAGFGGDVAGYRRFLATDPQFIVDSKEALRTACESLAKRIDRQIPAFFGTIPRITYGIESMTEAASEQLPPAYAQPNPVDRSSAGIFWLTALPARCPTYMLAPLTLHEAWPGHLMHLALLQEMDDLPAFRRHGAMKYTAYVEGWALYCESLGVEMGLYQTPHQQYGRMEMEVWRALRLIVDTGIHTMGWSRERAIETMAENVALPRPTIEAEVDRYIGLPGQALAYQLGNLSIRSLRQRAESTLGERFDLRAFHDQLLAPGPVSLPVLEEYVSSWIHRAG